MKKFFVFLILFLIAIFFIWQGIYTPKDFTFPEEKIFLVEKGQGLFQIGENLEKQGLIKSKFLFNFYVISKKKQGNLQAGQYLLSSSMNIPVISQKIISGDTAKIKITIPEGYNIEQIEERLTLNLTRNVLVNIKINEFRNEYDFLKDMPNNASLEGFLFPDTYYFYPHTKDLVVGVYPDVETEEIVRVFLDNFDEKLFPELREEIEKQDKTIFEIITMASMIEKEVRTIEDREIVSGILWKRLESKIPLQVDATVIYLTGKKTSIISKEDLKIDSPYNTYKYLGLPIGPICNPGLDSILAAVYPKDSDYWYYLSTLDGETIFGKTLKEHRINREKYLK